MNQPFINIHCHKAQDVAVKAVRNYIIGKEELPLNTNLAYFSAGLHPWYLPSYELTDLWLEQLQTVSLIINCLAIGEAGLDKVCKTPFELQQYAFLKQIDFSEKVEKPMIIHQVRSVNEILSIRKLKRCRQPWIIHGFFGSVAQANQLINNGCLLSFGDRILKETSKARMIFSIISPGDFFLETDDGDFSIKEIYSAVSSFTEISIENLIEHQNKNFITVFQLA